MSNEKIKSALWSAKSSIKANLTELEEVAADSRELKKAEAIEYSINPIKNIQKVKAVSDE